MFEKFFAGFFDTRLCSLVVLSKCLEKFENFKEMADVTNGRIRDPADALSRDRSLSQGIQEMFVKLSKVW